MKKFYTFIAVACVAMTASAASFEKSSKTIDATRTVNTTIENAQPVAKLPEGIIKGLRTRADELPNVTGTYVFSGDYCMEKGGTPEVECDQFKLEPKGNSGVARGNYVLTGFMGSRQEMNVKVGVVAVKISPTESVDVMALQIPSKTPFDTEGRTMMVFGYGENDAPSIYTNPILFGIEEDGSLVYLYEGIAVLNAQNSGYWCVDVEVNKVNTTIETIEIEENATTKVEEEVPYSYETYVELKDNALNFYGFCGLSPIITFEIDKAKSTATATDQYAGVVPDQTGKYYDMTLVDWKTKDAVVTASLANIGEKCEMTVTNPEGWAAAVLPNVGYLLHATSTKITMNFNIPGLGAGVNGIMVDEDADAPVEYFNLTGVKVENPSNGLYIRRQGHNVSKVLVK